jgi:hypothetical protein
MLDTDVVNKSEGCICYMLKEKRLMKWSGQGGADGSEGERQTIRSMDQRAVVHRYIHTFIHSFH